MIENESPVIANSLWNATTEQAPYCPPLEGEITADVAIIGAGFTGLSAALHLAAQRKRVVVLEAQTPGWGGSGRNGGQVNPGLVDLPEQIEARFGTEVGARMVDMAGRAPDLVFELIGRYGIFCEATRTGLIRAANGPRTMKIVQDYARQWQARGVPVAVLNADEIRAYLGGGAYAGGYLDPRAGTIQPLTYALGLADAALREGAVIYGHSSVLRMEQTGAAHRIVTPGGVVRARKVLVATNAYSDGLFDAVRRSVVPVRSVQVATQPLPDDIAASILPGGQAAVDMRRLLLYYRKDAAGRFIMGGRGAPDDAATLLRLQSLREISETVFPQLAGVAWSHAWGGYVAITPDHLPRLNRLGDGVLAGYGYNGLGVAMGTAMGKVMADWALDVPEDALDFPVTPARPIPFHRFRDIGVRLTMAKYKLLDRWGR